ncbi:uncharacterized protein Bfra_001582 [Botrytis fragariae]|uniref:Uncharacterized protein n=1 Tax=Botrytis fragariae TaxID=1964551 RepID=A0A8H6EM17_9HELO|nr:uncharacterized protein Bfra_001582 [Botrytis fragariae]KAF5877217.1 hypothetical protein Bfra_001582 [Botrytis fragariae]
MCRFIYSLAACGHGFITGKQKREQHLAWEAESSRGSAPPPACSTPEADLHDVQTYEGNCYDGKQKFSKNFGLDMVELREEAILIKRDMNKAILAADDVYTGKQRYEILKRFELYNQAFEMMFEDAEHALQSAQEGLIRVQGEVDGAKKEAAEWKKYARLLKVDE